MSSDFPDYYAILSLPSTPPPSADDIRQAYKSASLKTHPDRSPHLSDADRRRATAAFQKVADAYYILSDPGRRREYDRLRADRGREGKGPGAGGSGANGNYFERFFGAGSTPADPPDYPPTGGFNGHPDPDATFAEVFEDMLRPEVQSYIPMWKYVGTASGAALGFIIGNLPGLAVGAWGGNRLGAIRDAKGKSVYSVFIRLDGSAKAAILRGLAMKVLGTSLA